MRIKLLVAAFASLVLVAPSWAQTEGKNTMSNKDALTRDDVRMVAPALARYAQEAVQENLWRRPDLSPRDRSIVTLSALFAHNQTDELPTYVNLTPWRDRFRRG